MKVTMSALLATLAKITGSITNAFRQAQVPMVTTINDPRVYCVTYREVYRRKWLLSFVPFKVKADNIVIVEDPTTGYCAKPNDIKWYGERVISKDGDAPILVGTRDELMYAIESIDHALFDHAKTIDHLRAEVVSDFVNNFVDTLPQVQMLFQIHLKQLIANGVTVFKDIVVADHSCNDKWIKAETTPVDFLDYYQRKLRLQCNAKITTHLPTKDDIAREVLREGLLRHFMVTDLMESEDIGDLASQLYREEKTFFQAEVDDAKRTGKGGDVDKCLLGDHSKGILVSRFSDVDLPVDTNGKRADVIVDEDIVLSPNSTDKDDLGRNVDNDPMNSMESTNRTFRKLATPV